MSINKETIILGIDPGTVVMGYGILKTSGAKLELLSMGVVRLSKFEDPYMKLSRIYESVQSLIKQYNPESCAIEAPFFGKNVQSMLKLGRAQGVAIAAAMAQQVQVHEYSPKKIKMSLTGNGNASKEQVAGMVQQLLKYEIQPNFLDATDGIATAICHHFQLKNPFAGEKGVSGWEQFIKKNPHRVKQPS